MQSHSLFHANSSEICGGGGRRSGRKNIAGSPAKCSEGVSARGDTLFFLLCCDCAQN